LNSIKISVITVTYNAASTVGRCIQSVINQNYPYIEHIIIDGGSGDNTLAVINSYKDHITRLVSEKDKGIYDAMNKGISLATGDIIGMLNADDFYTNDNVLSEIAQAFEHTGADAVYADLDFVNGEEKVIRRWHSGNYKAGIFNYGWMPPHPTFYCKRELYMRLGTYSLEFGTAADYELMLRFIHLHKASIFYIPQTLVKMQAGGVSNKNAFNRIRSLYNDLKAMYKNEVTLPPIALILKPIRKIRQFLN
jgi:glycosyltransferase involved in cell wall biosynthesis